MLHLKSLGMRAGEFVKAVILSCCSVDSQECTNCYTSTLYVVRMCIILVHYIVYMYSNVQLLH